MREKKIEREKPSGYRLLSTRARLYINDNRSTATPAARAGNSRSRRRSQCTFLLELVGGRALSARASERARERGSHARVYGRCTLVVVTLFAVNNARERYTGITTVNHRTINCTRASVFSISRSLWHGGIMRKENLGL